MNRLLITHWDYSTKPIQSLWFPLSAIHSVSNSRIVDSGESIFELVSPHIKIRKGYNSCVNDLCRIHFYQIIENALVCPFKKKNLFRGGGDRGAELIKSETPLIKQSSWLVSPLVAFIYGSPQASGVNTSQKLSAYTVHTKAHIKKNYLQTCFNPFVTFLGQIWPR